MNSDRDVETYLHRYRSAGPREDLWKDIERRVARRARRFRAAQWAAAVLVAASLILRFATVQLDRELAAGAPAQPVDIETLAVALNGTTEGVQ